MKLQRCVQSQSPVAPGHATMLEVSQGELWRNKQISKTTYLAVPALRVALETLHSKFVGRPPEELLEAGVVRESEALPPHS